MIADFDDGTGTARMDGRADDAIVTRDQLALENPLAHGDDGDGGGNDADRRRASMEEEGGKEDEEDTADVDLL